MKIILSGEQFSQLVKGSELRITPLQGESVEISLAPMTYGVMMSHIQAAIETSTPEDEFDGTADNYPMAGDNEPTRKL